MKPGLPDIKHRLQSMHYLEFIINWQKENGFDELEISIAAESKPFIETKSIFITAPIIDIGVISMRILLEFMGLKIERKTGSLVNRKERKSETDDIFIEDFKTASEESLALVPLDGIKELFPDNHQTVCESLQRTIQNAHKGTAHLTNYRVTDPHVFEMYLYAAEGIRRLMKHHFYSKINQPYPTIK